MKKFFIFWSRFSVCPVGGSLGHTYSLLLPLADRAELLLGYFDTCLLRGQEAANMAPPRTSRNDPPQAMKMAAPNSNLKNKRKGHMGNVNIIYYYHFIFYYIIAFGQSSRVFLNPVPGCFPTLHILHVFIIEPTQFNSSALVEVLQELKWVCWIRKTSKCVFLGDLQEQSWDILLQKLCKVEFLVLTWCWLEWRGCRKLESHCGQTTNRQQLHRGL